MHGPGDDVQRDEMPADFPDVAAVSTVSGYQLKFTLTRDGAGRLVPPGNTRAGRQARYEQCRDLVDLGGGLLREKAAKPKYAELSPAQMLAKLRVNLREDFGLTVEEQDWVLSRVAERLGWQVRSALQKRP